jgi:hypothetical protein
LESTVTSCYRGVAVGVHGKLAMLLLGGIVTELSDLLLLEGVGVYDKLVVLLHMLYGHVEGYRVFLYLARGVVLPLLLFRISDVVERMANSRAIRSMYNKK